METGRKFTVGVALLLGLALAASYANSFQVGFYFDDTYGIALNPAIQSLGNIPRFFIDPYAINPVDKAQADLRPVLFTTYVLNYAISGLNPWSYHLLNLLIHFAAALVVFVTVRDHIWWPAEMRGSDGEARIVAAAAALFFALAPLNSQPVVYIWARSALLCTTLYLGAFLCYLRRRSVLGSLLFALALLTKAIAVTLPVMLLLYSVLYRDRKRLPRLGHWLRAWSEWGATVLLPGSLTLAYLVYRSAIIPGWTGQAMHEPWATPWLWFVSQWPALLYYVRLFVWPDDLSADHEFPWTFSALQPRAVGSLLVLLVWLGLALRAARTNPQVTFATLWFFVTLAPESSFAPLAEVINDHRPYIASSLGLSVLLAWGLDQTAGWLGARRQTAFVAVGAVLCLAAIPMNCYRCWQWGDALRLWEDTVRKSPGNPRAWMNAGQLLVARGDLQKGREYLERARVLRPGYALVYMNLSVLEAREGRREEALRWAQEGVRLAPERAQSHFFLGHALEGLGRRDEAIAAYGRAVELNPDDAAARQALTALGGAGTGALAVAPDPDESRLMSDGLSALQRAKDPARAAELFRQVLARNPTHYGATYQLAVALDQIGHAAEARPLWEAVHDMAVRIGDAPTIEKARTRLARNDAEVAAVEVHMRAGLDALYTRNDAPAAVSEFRQVLAHSPTHYGATYQLATALDKAGQRDEARGLWARVLEMAEQYSDAPTVATARSRLAGNR